MADTTVNRFLGGSPLAVLVRLIVVSLLVGALMSWLEIDPIALFGWVRRSLVQLWGSGFEALRQAGRYVVTGAAVVIPLWLLSRLTSIGSRDNRRTQSGRWTLPGSPGPVDASANIRNEPKT